MRCSIEAFAFPIVAAFVASLSQSAHQLGVSGVAHFAANIQDDQKSSDRYSGMFGLNVLHKWDTARIIERSNVKIGLFIVLCAMAISNLNDNLVIRKIVFVVDADKFPEAIAELKSNRVDLSETHDTGMLIPLSFMIPMSTSGRSRLSYDLRSRRLPKHPPK